MDVADRIAGWIATQRWSAVEAGLSKGELRRAEDTFGVTFPPLWRSVLSRVHPASMLVAPQPWRLGASPRDASPKLRPLTAVPDWRLRDETGTRRMIDAPVDGVLFDVQDNGFWWHAWGTPPAAAADRLALARRELSGVPALIPLYGPLCIAVADESPVFRLVQTHCSVTALTLADLPDERGQGAVPLEQWPIGRVPFWSELHAYSQAGDVEARFGGLGTGGLGTGGLGTGGLSG